MKVDNWRLNNPEKARQANRESYQRNRERIRERQRKSYHATKDKKSEYLRQWYIDNPDARTNHSSARRARERGVIHENIDRQAVIKRDNSTCYICGKRLIKGITLDHVIPIIKGGSHTADNLKVCCQPCNSRKHSLTLLEFIVRFPMFASDRLIELTLRQT